MIATTVTPQKTRPILFSAPMVRAIMEGRKTQTRRVVTDKRLSPKLTLLELFDFLGGGGTCDSSGEDGLRVSFVRDYDRQSDDGGRYKYTGLLVQSEAAPEDGAEEFPCHYGQSGDWLWVRETHYVFGWWVKNGLTKTGKQAWKFRHDRKHPIRFPGENIELVKCKKQRGYFKLNSIFMPRWASRITLEITGVRVERLQEISVDDCYAEGCKDWGRNHIKAAYANLWDSINGEGAWEKNPWVWVIDFCRVLTEKV